MVRFALVDDDSSDEEGMTATQETRSSRVTFSGIAATPQQAQSNRSILRRKPTPHVTASRVRFDQSMQQENEDQDHMDTEEINEAKIVKTVSMNADKTYAQVYSIVEKKKATMSPAAAARGGLMTESNIVEEEAIESELTPSNFAPPDSSLMIPPSQNSIITKLTSKRRSLQRNSIDVGLRCGKSFRVGFHPSGNLFCSTSINTAKEGVLGQSISPKFGESHMVSLDLFQLLISKCTQDMEYGECPLLQVPLAFKNGGDANSHAALLNCLERMAKLEGNSEAGKAFQLLATLLEAPEASSSVVIAGDQASQQYYTFNERRNQALLQWLIDVNASDVNKEVQTALQQNNVAAAIFAAVSGGNLDKATQIAADAGLLDLAITLATDVKGRAQLASMVDRALKSGGSISIPQTLLRTLRAVAGDDVMEESLHRTGSRLSWTRRFALKFLQNPPLDLQTLLDNYDDLARKGLAPLPSPKYDGAGPQVESVQYRILRAIADPSSLSVSEVVHTNGFTDNPHDLSYSFLLATTLVASGYIDGDDLMLEKIADGFAAQLFAQGEWEWGVAACLCASGKTTMSTALAKMKRAHDYVLKFYGPANQTRLSFLTDTIGIPSSWCSEALAYKADNVLGFLDHMNNSAPDDAAVALEEHWLPNAFFKNKGLSAVEDMVGDAPDSLAAAVYRLQKLDSEIQLLRSGNAQTISDALPNLVNECRLLRKTFEEALVENSKQDGLHSFATTSRVESKHMLREAIRLVTKLDFQLASLSTA